jgi:hypothetical protein
MDDNKIGSELVLAEEQINNDEKVAGTSKSDNDVFWILVEQRNIQEKKLQERVVAMTTEELELCMKETFESRVYYEFLRGRKKPTKEIIAEKFDSVYHENRLWGPQIFTRRVCGCGWAPCYKKDEMVDEMFNKIADVPFPTEG